MSSQQSANDHGFLHKFHAFHKGVNRPTTYTPTQDRVGGRHTTRVDSHTDQDIDMQTVTNTTRCFRSGPVTAVKKLEVNDSNFPALYNYQPAQHGAERVTQKTKSGHTMNPGKVQDSKVTTFSALNPTS